MGWHRYADRAKIFAPFDALKGLREALREQERIVVRMERKDLLPDQVEIIDRQLHNLKNGDLVEIIYYDGDTYVKKTGLISGIFPKEKQIRVVDTGISFEDIYSIADRST